MSSDKISVTESQFFARCKQNRSKSTKWMSPPFPIYNPHCSAISTNDLKTVTNKSKSSYMKTIVQRRKTQFWTTPPATINISNLKSAAQNNENGTSKRIIGNKKAEKTSPPSNLHQGIVTYISSGLGHRQVLLKFLQMSRHWTRKTLLIF